MKQYMGGHNETWGGVTINIDRDFLDLGKRRGGAGEALRRRRTSTSPTTRGCRRGSDAGLVKALQCLLTEQKAYAGKVNGGFNKATARRRPGLAADPRPARARTRSAGAPG